MLATVISPFAPAVQSVKSVYRLVLRGASAAVLHHRTARDTLRKLYRPTFDEAFRQLERHSDEESQGKATEAKDIELWMSSWNEKSEYLQVIDCVSRVLITLFFLMNRKVDNTLSFLLASATTRGVEHRVTRNLTRLAHFRSRRLRQAASVRQSPWNPRLPAQVYSKVSSGLSLTKADKAMAGSHLVGLVQRAEQAARKEGGTLDDGALKQAQFEDGIWNVIGETARMAEEQSGIGLGRARFGRSGELL